MIVCSMHIRTQECDATPILVYDEIYRDVQTVEVMTKSMWMGTPLNKVVMKSMWMSTQLK